MWLAVSRSACLATHARGTPPARGQQHSFAKSVVLVQEPSTAVNLRKISHIRFQLQSVNSLQQSHSTPAFQPPLPIQTHARIQLPPAATLSTQLVASLLPTVFYQIHRVHSPPLSPPIFLPPLQPPYISKISAPLWYTKCLPRVACTTDCDTCCSSHESPRPAACAIVQHVSRTPNPRNQILASLCLHHQCVPLHALSQISSPHPNPTYHTSSHPWCAACFHPDPPPKKRNQTATTVQDVR